MTFRGSAGTVATAAWAALIDAALPQDGNYLMLVGLEGTDAAGQKVLHEEKLLRCLVDLPGKILTELLMCRRVPGEGFVHRSHQLAGDLSRLCGVSK